MAESTQAVDRVTLANGHTVEVMRNARAIQNACRVSSMRNGENPVYGARPGVFERLRIKDGRQLRGELQGKAASDSRWHRIDFAYQDA
jgi:hypothetical protein